MTQKSCAVGMRNAKLENHLKQINVSLYALIVLLLSIMNFFITLSKKLYRLVDPQTILTMSWWNSTSITGETHEWKLAIVKSPLSSIQQSSLFTILTWKGMSQEKHAEEWARVRLIMHDGNHSKWRKVWDAALMIFLCGLSNFVALWTSYAILIEEGNKPQWQERSRTSLNGTGKRIQGR